MRKCIFLILFLFCTLLNIKTAFSGEFANLSIYNINVPIPYILSYYEPYIILSNNGNITANITEQKVEGMNLLNYRLENPLSIHSNALGKYLFQTKRKLLCGEFGNLYNIQFNISYYNETNVFNNVTSQTYPIQVKNPLNIINVSVTTNEKLTIKTTESKKIYVTIENNATLPLTYNFSVSYQQAFYIKFSSPGASYERAEFTSTNFTLFPKQRETITLDIIPTFETEGSLFFQIREISGCANAQSNFTLLLKTITQASSKISELMPENDFLSVLVLLVLVSFVLYYTKNLNLA